MCLATALWARLDRVVYAADRDDAHLVPVEHLHGRLVETGRIERDHGRVGLAGAAGGEQLVDVDAPLEHHHPAAGSDQLQHRRLPRRSGGHHQDDDHVRRLAGRLVAALIRGPRP